MKSLQQTKTRSWVVTVLQDTIRDEEVECHMVTDGCIYKIRQTQDGYHLCLICRSLNDRVTGLNISCCNDSVELLAPEF
jgi:hypothetical protein